MKLNIYTDVHLYSPAYDGTQIKDVENSYFIGDIVDLANCKKEDIAKCMTMRNAMKVNSKGWIDGNHERISLSNDNIHLTRVLTRVVMVHGDFEAWGDERAVKYRSKSHGAGFLKRQLWTRALKFFEDIWPVKVSKKMITNLHATAVNHSSDIIIAGHVHPSQRFDKVIDGVRIIVLKRGHNIVEI